MTESSLLQEIEDDLQRQKMAAFWKRYGLMIAAGAAMIVLGTAAHVGYRAYIQDKEQTATSALVQIATDYDMDQTARLAALQDLAAKDPAAGTSVLARMTAATVALREGKTDEAVAIYDAMEADAKIEPFFRQWGTLLSVQSQMDKGDPAVLLARLQPLMQETVPLRFSAHEYAGHLYLKQNMRADAIRVFSGLSAVVGAPAGIAGRARDMLEWLNQTSK